MKKANEKFEGAEMEVVHSSLGVRTKAETLVSQSVSLAAAVEDGGIDVGESNMELRSGKLEKPAELSDKKRQKCPSPEEPNSMLSKQRVGNENKKRRYLDAGKIEEEKEKEKEEKKVQENEKINREEEENEENRHVNGDGFLGDKVLVQYDGKERRTMENTPCNLIVDADTVKTPGSSPKRPCSGEADSREQKSILSNIPTVEEIEEYFAAKEKMLLEQFIEKYNFDFVNENPLPAGRYEWRIDP